MIEAIRKHWPGALSLVGTAFIAFMAGQFFPIYAEDAVNQRKAVIELFDLATAKGNELEKSIRPLMLVAGKAVPPSEEPRRSLDERMLDLFQTLEAIGNKFPASEPKREAYVKAMLQLKGAAKDLDGPLTGKSLIEAASAFKKARTEYEKKLAALKPSFVGAMRSNFSL